MSKTTRALSGGSLRKYLRELFASDPAIPADTARRLLETCQSEISQVRVRTPLPVRARVASPQPNEPVSAASEFDPFAFSAVVVLTKGGRAALEARLAQIGEPDNLKLLASAQHISIPADAATARALRCAIIEGTERRIAGRKAAAS